MWSFTSPWISVNGAALLGHDLVGGGTPAHYLLVGSFWGSRIRESLSRLIFRAASSNLCLTIDLQKTHQIVSFVLYSLRSSKSSAADDWITSRGRLGSLPCININGVSPVAGCGLDRYAKSAPTRYQSQVPGDNPWAIRSMSKRIALSSGTMTWTSGRSDVCTTRQTILSLIPIVNGWRERVQLECSMGSVGSEPSEWHFNFLNGS
jgi:hypothetical protein